MLLCRDLVHAMGLFHCHFARQVLGPGKFQVVSRGAWAHLLQGQVWLTDPECCRGSRAAPGAARAHKAGA